MIDTAEHYAKRMAEFHGERGEPGGIAFVGSSHVELFPTAELLPEWRFINRGIASDRIGFSERGILKRLDVSIFDLEPALILLENGANDLGELWRTGTPSIKEIEAGYRRMVAAIRDRLPATPLCLIGVLPTTGRFEGLLPWLPPFNETIRGVAREHACDFMNAYPLLVDDRGRLRDNLTTDGLHLNRAGYDVWAGELRSYLNSLSLLPSARASGP